MPIKAILFDCFGVLLGNTLQQWTSQLSPEDAETFLALTYSADKGVISEEEATIERAALLGISPRALTDGFAAGEVPNIQLMDAIKILKQTYKIGLLSNIHSKERIASRLPAGVLDELFESITISGDLGIIKPDPHIYEYAAHSLGVLPEECVMIDDVGRFCEGARAVGMRAVQFQTTAQAMADLRQILDEVPNTV